MKFVHATCVSLNGQGILIRGPSGAGKSDLALRLIDAGAILVADDYVDIQKKNGRLLASPPNNIAGKIEVRGVGLIKLPFKKNVEISLVLRLSPRSEIPRLPDFHIADMDGIPVPFVMIDAQDSSAVAKVKIALEYFNQTGETRRRQEKDVG